MRGNYIKHTLALLVVLLVGLQTKDVYAYQGSVTFGSESYSWSAGHVSPIGIYFNGEVPVGSYEICVEYDENALRYLNGATEQVGNRLYIRGSGVESTYKNMLHFEPLQAGSTSIQIISATGMTAGDVSENIAAEAIEITQLSAAPIRIFEAASSQLQQLAIDGGELEGFSAEVYEYFVEVENYMENLNLTYLAEDEAATVSVSDTTLQVGENVITVTVKATTGDESIYTIHVVRKEFLEEPEEIIIPEEPIEPEQSTDSELTIEINGSEEDSSTANSVREENIDSEEQESAWKVALIQVFLKNPVLWCITTVVAILVLVQFILFFKSRKKEHQQQDEEAVEDIKIINLEQDVIKVQNVTMRFRLAQEESSSLKEYMIRTVKGQNHYHYLTALDNVSFDVKQGDVVGIIGTNGSGKSTLLKIISGALSPSEGHVEVDRSKVQMLTLGTGFDMELTAKENVYLNGAIIGYSREYIDEKYDDIVAFAELEGFMDERMKNFSSGMISRLGFAIATMRDTPDILILDEVLSVGDMFFREKSMKRIKEMIHSGATVLIVSHSVDTILKNCNRAVWIEKGVMQMMGEPKEVCDAYKNYEVTGMKK